MELGASFLRKFGWKEGEGLGPRKDGIIEPLQIRKRTENLGLGAEKEKAKAWDSWWEDVYNQHASKQSLITKEERSFASTSDDDSDGDDNDNSAVNSMTDNEVQDAQAAPNAPVEKTLWDLTGLELLQICRCRVNQ